MRLVLIVITSLLASSPVTGQPSVDGRPVTATTNDRNYLRAFPLTDGSVFTTVLSTAHEDHAMTATLKTSNGTVQRFRATQWLPDEAYTEGTAGQIYAAVILGDDRTLAVSIGWTNRAGRNINGIALLDRAVGGWERRTVGSAGKRARSGRRAGQWPACGDGRRGARTACNRAPPAGSRRKNPRRAPSLHDDQDGCARTRARDPPADAA